MKSLSTLIEMNASALQHLESDRFTDAIQGLTEALQLYRSEVTVATSSASEEDHAQENAARLPSFDDLIICQGLRMSRKQQQQQQQFQHRPQHFDCCTTSGADSVFRSAIYLPEQLKHVSQSTARSMIAPTLVFNLALAYHISAIDNQLLSTEMRNRSLMKASRLYVLANECLQEVEEEQQEERMDDGEAHDNSSVLLTLAIVNNLAMLNRSLGLTAVSKRFFERLFVILMFLSNQGSESDSHNGCRTSLPAYQFFYNNVSNICDTPLAPAA